MSHNAQSRAQSRSAFFSLPALLLCSVLLLLTSCGTAPVKDTHSIDGGEQNIALEEITQILEDADKQDKATRIRIYLDVTQTLLAAEEVDWARNTLALLSPYAVPQDQYIRYAVISSALAIAQGHPFRAKAFLWEERVERVAQEAPLEEQVKLNEMRARLLFALAEYRASIDVRLHLHSLLAEGAEPSVENQNRLWQTLMELPYDDLQLESQLQESMLAKGWYTLAALSKNNQTNLGQQIAEVEQWMFSWPEHPASMQLPADLQLLKQLDQDKPQQIAILLPFSGRFESVANAIRDGIMAAYYDANTRENSVPNLHIYDTSSGDINALYDDAVLNGAQLIIGPLEKEKIADLALRPELPVPTLALNRIETDMPVPAGLFQFGLSLEDDAEQVAEQAWRDGHRRAMVLAPTSTSGDRSVESFQARWAELGGDMTKDYRYADQGRYSDLVKSALKINDSEQRRRDVQSLIGKRVEFEPRRRKDIDYIFLYSHATAARQLKPILAFHYAGDVPVYSMRNIYNGKANSKRDRDLNDIRFTTLPWFFDKNLPEKRAILSAVDNANYEFLYALGVDAYHIHPRLRQLKEVKQAHFYGTTGNLRLDEQQRIRREQIWAKFSKGRAVPMTRFTSEDDV